MDKVEICYQQYLYGSRISLIVGFAAILFSLILGVGLGINGWIFWWQI